MSRVRIEIFDGDFEDAPSYTRESVAECEGDDLRAAFERAVVMARAALPPDRDRLSAEGGFDPPPRCDEVPRPGWRCQLPVEHIGGHEFVPARCASQCPLPGSHGGGGRCTLELGHLGDHRNARTGCACAPDDSSGA